MTVDDEVVRVGPDPHPLTGAPFHSPVPPGTGWFRVQPGILSLIGALILSAEEMAIDDLPPQGISLCIVSEIFFPPTVNAVSLETYRLT